MWNANDAVINIALIEVRNRMLSTIYFIFNSPHTKFAMTEEIDEPISKYLGIANVVI